MLNNRIGNGALKWTTSSARLTKIAGIRSEQPTKRGEQPTMRNAKQTEIVGMHSGQPTMRNAKRTEIVGTHNNQPTMRGEQPRGAKQTKIARMRTTH
jgi:hypothetical protein